jgi:diguanylate cyclase (GGDEF)-like protein
VWSRFQTHYANSKPSNCTSDATNVTFQTMDESAAPERDREQAPSADVPPGWADTQESLAAAAGLSILLVAGPQPPALAVSNNNSICHAFQSSPEHVRLCDPYCGRAFDRAREAGAATHYRCHAGLHCFAMPLEPERGRKLAVIGGRAFLTSADYRALAERFRAGDLQDLLSGDLFKNVIFAARQDLDDLAERLASAALGPRLPPGKEAVTDAPHVVKEETRARGLLVQENGTATGGALKDACAAAAQSLARQHKIDSLALLLLRRDKLAATFATGRYEKISLLLEIEAQGTRLIEAATKGASLAVRESAAGLTLLQRAPARQARRAQEKASSELFPLMIGGEVRGALLVGDASLTDAKRRAIIESCRELALPLEVLRLRHELEERTRAAYSLQSFTECLNQTAPAETYLSILRQSAELLKAERGSLLLFDETTNELAVKAAVGLRAEVASEARISLGHGISGTVLQNGRPLVVRDLDSAGHTPAPAERLYKTKSFISYPIVIGGRKVGVLNVTDKADGGSYDEIDLSLIESIAPQMALALDRAEWHEKATQFQLMSITDPLTGLLNRRYLEERLTEELKRSQRYSYAMSFMMIDIDDFKLYNDRNGHQAGDLALEMTAQCLKSALRSADVAARYGGEEFCILLPQTTLTEANAIGERIRRRVERTRYPHGKAQPLGAVTVSIGISAFSAGLEEPATIIRAADRALYLAKSEGKNRVRSHEDVQSGTPKNNAAEDAT